MPVCASMEVMEALGNTEVVERIEIRYDYKTLM